MKIGKFEIKESILVPEGELWFLSNGKRVGIIKNIGKYDKPEVGTRPSLLIEGGY